MIDFCPQDPGAKETGRVSMCSASGLTPKEAAPFFREATPTTFQSHYNSFIDAFPKQAKEMSTRRPSGVGPGELIAWFLFDNITLGGANASCDLLVDGQDFAEMKAGSYCKRDHSLQDFKLSRDQDASVSYIVNALASNQNAVIIDAQGVARDVNGNVLAAYGSADFTRQVDEIIAEKRQKSVDNLYRNHVIQTWKDQIFQEYLEGKQMALIQTSDLRMRYFGQLTKDMVGLYRIHRNQPWARVFLPT